MNRNSGQTAAVPLMAASTWSHAPWSRHTCPIGPRGSRALDEVVPTVAHTKHGARPADRSRSIASRSRSGRMANCSSHSINRRFSRPIPAIMTAFSIDEWPCVEV